MNILFNLTVLISMSHVAVVYLCDLEMLCTASLFSEINLKYLNALKLNIQFA
jgi:hypothetical protein